MHPSIPGYRLNQEIHRSSRSLVFRGVREADQVPVVLKTSPKDYPEPEDLARLRREYRLLSAHALPGVVRVHDLAPWGNNVALVMEDCGAEPLAAQLKAGRPMALGPFFRLAIACSRALGCLHQRMIHKDLNPRNILWNPETEAVRFIDFGLASAIADGPEAPVTRRLVGSLAFISPEQTGRLNREVDCRTDFYSLGVTFYLLLTGQLPFTATDAVEWVHCHLTQSAPSPDQLTATVPPLLGELVMKLIAKNPEDRYQSAPALLRDLLECERRWAETGAIAPFALGRDDVLAQFQVPHRLYGREAETRTLLEAYQDAAAGRTTLVAVAGRAGIGKSALVGEAFRAIVEAGGQACEGKFDQFQRHVPYAAVTQALNGLVRQVMAEPEASLARWRARLLETLGPNGRIAVDLVPALAGVIGVPAPVVALNPTEEQNRFLATIQSLIALFARPERPLVLFLDDLQWSDPSTLLLMRSLLASCNGDALLVIGAYRDDEVQEGDPLLMTLADLERSHRVRRMQLSPLPEQTLNAIVADALHTCREETQALSMVLHRKSAGNPFFVGELLRTLHQDGLFAFDHEAGRWRWDLEGVQRAQISDDIVDFMLSRIQRLAPETQSTLRKAACIGHTFDLVLLAGLAERSVDEVSQRIAPAVAAGLVVPLDGAATPTRCQFPHDRVRQAAYALTPEDARRSIHARIGRLLLACTPDDEREARAPEIAQQLNEGRSLLTTDEERLELVALNLEAARKAKASAAYGAAFEFTSVGRELLPAGAWESHYALAFETFKLHASCAYLSGDLTAADTCYAELLERARTILERAEVRAMRAAQYTFGNRMALSIDEGIRALALLGIRLTAKPSMAVVARELAYSKLLLGRRTARDLDDAPRVEDPAVRLAMKVLEGFLVPAYLMGNETLFAATVLKHANLSLRHGNCLESVSAYAGYAVLLAGLGDLKGAHAFGQLALRLTERFGVVDSKCRTLTLYTLFSHSWSEPWGTLEAWFRDAVETGLQTGDFLFMAFSCGYVHLWDPRIDLQTAVEEGRKSLALCRQTHEKNALEAAMIAQQFWLCLRGETHGPLSLSDAAFDEADCLARMERAHYVSGNAIFHLFKLQAACISEAWDQAWELLLKTDRTIKALAGSPYVVEYCVYGFLAAAQIASVKGPNARAAFGRVRRFHRQMQGWARHNPDTFRHHALLMEAELARLKGRHDDAAHGYDQAVAAARQSGFVRYEAQANEVAARFFRAGGLDQVASAYLRDARDGYVRWGATAKVRMLDAAWPELAAKPAPQADRTEVHLAQLHRFNLGLVPQLVESGMLDLSTIWKATQAISGEATLERLLERLMAIVKENAGAQKAVLVLKEGDDGSATYMVQAESPADGESRLLQAEPLDHHPEVPVSVIRYVLRTQTSVVLNNPARQGAHTRDPYFQARQPQSVLALPIVNQGHLLGALYLENNLVSEAFTPEHLSILQILAGQAAVSIRNVRGAERAAYLEAERTIKDTYARELEVRVQERTAELQRAYQQLMELDRLKTNFLSVVSHELRTPLTTIQGYAEFLEDRTGGDLSEDQTEFVSQIQQGARQLRRLVDDLLDFARAEAGALKLVRKPTDVTATIARAIESQAPILQAHGLVIEAELPSEPVWLQVDGGRISQVVLNLVGNAIKFTPRGGTLRVTLQVLGTDYRVEVTDSGIGIDPEHLPRLFQRFYQVDSSSTRERGGVGLGLAIAQSIVEAHGGRIGVSSVPAQGSTFWFTLPQQALDQAASASGAATGGF